MPHHPVDTRSVPPDAHNTVNWVGAYQVAKRLLTKEPKGPEFWVWSLADQAGIYDDTELFAGLEKEYAENHRDGSASGCTSGLRAGFSGPVWGRCWSKTARPVSSASALHCHQNRPRRPNPGPDVHRVPRACRAAQDVPWPATVWNLSETADKEEDYVSASTPTL